MKTIPSFGCVPTDSGDGNFGHIHTLTHTLTHARTHTHATVFISVQSLQRTRTTQVNATEKKSLGFQPQLTYPRRFVQHTDTDCLNQGTDLLPKISYS